MGQPENDTKIKCVTQTHLIRVVFESCHHVVSKITGPRWKGPERLMGSVVSLFKRGMSSRKLKDEREGVTENLLL